MYSHSMLLHYRFLKDCSNLIRRMNCVRRWRIHENNIVYYMVLPLLSCSISRVQSLHYIITTSQTSQIHIKGTITCFIPPFLECERWKYQSIMINYIMVWYLLQLFRLYSSAVWGFLWIQGTYDHPKTKV